MKSHFVEMLLQIPIFILILIVFVTVIVINIIIINYVYIYEPVLMLNLSSTPGSMKTQS